MRSAFLVALILCALAGSVHSSEPCTDSIYASVFEDTVHVFHNGSFYNCCAVIAFAFEIGDTTIDVAETETFPQGPCHCMCCFDLSVSIGGIPPGVYRVLVWNEDRSVLSVRVYDSSGRLASDLVEGNQPLECAQSGRSKTPLWGLFHQVVFSLKCCSKEVVHHEIEIDLA